MNIEDSLVRIRTASGRIVGAGLLASDEHVITCVHVIASAWEGLPPDVKQDLSAEVHLDFPLVAPESILTAQVGLWKPEEDIAGLILSTPKPVGAQSARLVVSDDVWEHKFRAFGFPSGIDQGVWASGVLRARTGENWLQLEDIKVPGARIEPGFSGGPVWDEQLNGIVGIVNAASTELSDKIAHVIPSDVLVKAWPDVQLMLSSVDLASTPMAVFHHVRDIPQPPVPYVAHPYTLLESSSFVGRRDELDVLTGWLTESSTEPGRASILCICDIGGMGKSALTWKWFKDIAPKAAELRGMLWWSFYETDAGFENFVLRALAYVSGRDRPEVQRIPKAEREQMLLDILHREPYLLILDGLERLLVAFSRRHTNNLPGDDDENSPDDMTGIHPASATGGVDSLRSPLRRTIDPHAGVFFRKLADCKASHVLMTSRLFPADLEAEVGGPIQGCRAISLEPMKDQDAIDWWRSIKVGDGYGQELRLKGSDEDLVQLFHSLGNYPLLIRIMAGIVANHRSAPCDYDAWKRAHPEFDPFAIRLQLPTRSSEILTYALAGLDEGSRRVLFVLSAFKKPASYNLISPFFIGDAVPSYDDAAFARSLSNLEDRGLIGWDKFANRYDMHPVVRGVIWGKLSDQQRRNIYRQLGLHFSCLLAFESDDVEKLEDLTTRIELYNVFIGIGQYDNAFRLFSQYLARPLSDHLSANDEIVELLTALFPRGIEAPPALSEPGACADVLLMLSHALMSTGTLELAKSLSLRHIVLSSGQSDAQRALQGLGVLFGSLLLSGAVYDSGRIASVYTSLAKHQLDHRGELRGSWFEASYLLMRGRLSDAKTRLEDAMSLLSETRDHAETDYALLSLSNIVQWAYDFLGELPPDLLDLTVTELYPTMDPSSATGHLLGNESLHRVSQPLERLQDAATSNKRVGDTVRALVMQSVMGTLGPSDPQTEGNLAEGLHRARLLNLASEELFALTSMARFLADQGKGDEARSTLDDVWGLAETGPYPFILAFAYFTLFELEVSEGNTLAAVDAATKMYTSSWGDGPPFCQFMLGLAGQCLDVLNAPYPDLEAFDESKHLIIPEIEDLSAHQLLASLGSLDKLV